MTLVLAHDQIKRCKIIEHIIDVSPESAICGKQTKPNISVAMPPVAGTQQCDDFSEHPYFCSSKL